MKVKEANIVLDAVLKGSSMSLISGVMSMLSAVKGFTPTTDGEEAKTQLLNELAELALITTRIIQSVLDDADDVKLIELASKYNSQILKANEGIERLVSLAEDDYNKAIPEERQKSLLKYKAEQRKEDERMEQFAKAMKQFKQAIAGEKKGAQIVEPIPGVLMLRDKQPGEIASIPKVEYTEA